MMLVTRCSNECSSVGDTQSARRGFQRRKRHGPSIPQRGRAPPYPKLHQLGGDFNRHDEQTCFSIRRPLAAAAARRTPTRKNARGPCPTPAPALPASSSPGSTAALARAGPTSGQRSVPWPHVPRTSRPGPLPQTRLRPALLARDQHPLHLWERAWPRSLSPAFPRAVKKRCLAARHHATQHTL